MDSFTENLSIADLDGSREEFRAVYIRAPRILDTGPGCEVLARRGDEPVIVRKDRILGLSFHPELTSDTRIHAAFVALAATARG